MRSKGRTCRRSLPGALAVLLCLGAAPANAAERASASSTTRFLASFSGPTRKATKSFSSPVELLSYVVPAAHAQVESQQRSVPLVTLREAKAPGPAPASSDLKLEIVVDGGDGAA